MKPDKSPAIFDSTELASSDESFHPVRQNRQGELFAWLCTLGILIAILVLELSPSSTPVWIYFLFTFFILAGLSISFSQYLDSNTVIQTSSYGIKFNSPIRKTTFQWNQVIRLIATPSSGGWRIRVEGEPGYFHFRSPSRVKVGGRGELKIGFKDGNRLIAIIRGSARLERVEFLDGSWIARSVEHESSE